MSSSLSTGAEGSQPISIHVTFRGTSYPLSLLPESTLEALQIQLEALTNVPPPLQKLLYKGKKSSSSDVPSAIAQLGFKDGMKVQMLGTTERELGSVHAAEDAKRRREEVLAKRAASGPSKVRSTMVRTSSSPSSQFIFHRLEPLAGLPNREGALAMLRRLSADPAILHIMRTHRFSVGLLTELAPHEHPNLLGLNENKGSVIRLRLRTDAYDGLRLYSDVRRVLCHELTHNVWGNHDENFKTMNSQLNREVAEYETAERAGSHTLGGTAYESAYNPEIEVSAYSHILGGSGLVRTDSEDSREERRQLMLDATVRRLRQQEEELEASCGTAPGPANIAEPSSSSRAST